MSHTCNTMPDKEGWYWFRGSINDSLGSASVSEFYEIVALVQEHNSFGYMLLPKYTVGNSDVISGVWYGPLTPPWETKVTTQLIHETYDDAMKLFDTMLDNDSNTLFDDFMFSWLLDLIDEYENEYFPIEPPTPEAAAEFRRDQESDNE